MTYQVTIKNMSGGLKRYAVQADDAPSALQMVTERLREAHPSWLIVYAHIDVSNYPILDDWEDQ
jgi:hypothetical protein